MAQVVNPKDAYRAALGQRKRAVAGRILQGNVNVPPRNVPFLGAYDPDVALREGYDELTTDTNVNSVGEQVSDPPGGNSRWATGTERVTENWLSNYDTSTGSRTTEALRQRFRRCESTYGYDVATDDGYGALTNALGREIVGYRRGREYGSEPVVVDATFTADGLAFKYDTASLQTGQPQVVYDPITNFDAFRIGDWPGTSVFSYDRSEDLSFKPIMTTLVWRGFQHVVESDPRVVFVTPDGEVALVRARKESFLSLGDRANVILGNFKMLTYPDEFWEPLASILAEARWIGNMRVCVNGGKPSDIMIYGIAAPAPGTPLGALGITLMTIDDMYDQLGDVDIATGAFVLAVNFLCRREKNVFYKMYDPDGVLTDPWTPRNYGGALITDPRRMMLDPGSLIGSMHAEVDDDAGVFENNFNPVTGTQSTATEKMLASLSDRSGIGFIVDTDRVNDLSAAKASIMSTVTKSKLVTARDRGQFAWGRPLDAELLIPREDAPGLAKDGNNP